MIKMKDSGVEWIGKIPISWSVQRVKHAFVRKNEKAMIDAPIVLSLARSGVKIRDISNNEGQIAESYFNYNPVEEGDLLLNPMDLYSGANCSISKVSGVISPAYINLKSKAGYNSCFYDYYFKVQYWMMALFAHGKGVSFDNRWTLSVETLMNYPIVVPSFDEQCKRADYLDERCKKIDAIIEKQQAVIEKLKEYKLSVITEAVTKGLNPDVEMKSSKLEWACKVPVRWETTKINKIAQTSSGATPLRDKEADYFDNATIKWVRTLDLNDWFVQDSSEKITEEALKNSSCTIMPENTVCVAMYGGAGTIGKCGLLTSPSTTNQAVCSLVCSPQMYPLYMLFQLMAIRKYWMKYAVGTRKDPNISQEIVSKMNIILPPLNEQKEIAHNLKNRCEEIDNTISLKTNMINKLIEYKKSLIYEVVTGKKEV